MAVATALPQSPLLLPRRVGVVLLGAVDNVNTVFTTPTAFVVDPPFDVPAVYLNGVRLLATDYALSESGGPGTGFDTVTTSDPLRATLKAVDVLTADYSEE